MAKLRPCTVCGKPTNELLFRNEMLSIPICSRKCEYEYLHKLSPDMKEQINILGYLDKQIEKNKKLDRIGWSISGFALIAMIIAIVLANVTLFIAGTVIVTFATLATRYFEDKIDRLVKMRKRIVI